MKYFIITTNVEEKYTTNTIINTKEHPIPIYTKPELAWILHPIYTIYTNKPTVYSIEVKKPIIKENWRIIVEDKVEIKEQFPQPKWIIKITEIRIIFALLLLEKLFFLKKEKTLSKSIKKFLVFCDTENTIKEIMEAKIELEGRIPNTLYKFTNYPLRALESIVDPIHSLRLIEKELKKHKLYLNLNYEQMATKAIKKSSLMREKDYNLLNEYIV